MGTSLHAFTNEQLEEVFPNPAVREVAFEIRFPPRLRVNAELWRFQDHLAEEYPNPDSEAVLMPPSAAPINVSVFQSPATGRTVKVSQQNFVLAFTRYTCFEDFKAEVLAKTRVFCETFEVKSLTRVGLRYVNEIILPTGEDRASMLRFVRPIIDFSRVGIESVEEFFTQIRIRHRNHMVLLRSVTLPDSERRNRAYVLDIDCHSQGALPFGSLESVLDEYHDTAQRYFLDHITEEFKNKMRGAR